MDWNNLKNNDCPSCSNPLEYGIWNTICSFCGFTGRTDKLKDISLGKASKSYKIAVERNQTVTKNKKRFRASVKLQQSLQNNERLSNLRRMRDRGEISEEEYLSKTSK